MAVNLHCHNVVLTSFTGLEEKKRVLSNEIWFLKRNTKKLREIFLVNFQRNREILFSPVMIFFEVAIPLILQHVIFVSPYPGPFIRNIT